MNKIHLCQYVNPNFLIQAMVDGMIERKFGRVINITFFWVKFSIVTLELSSRARVELTKLLLKNGY
jgi:3-oxoacyl-[acyl-carrier protein] reductase